MKFRKLPLVFVIIFIPIVTISYVIYGHVLRLVVQSNPLQSSAENVQAGQVLFTVNCVSCHGKTGKGDGEFAADLAEQPKDLTRGKSVFPGWNAVWITYGGDVMPVWKDRLSEEQIWQLSTYLDTLHE